MKTILDIAIAISILSIFVSFTALIVSWMFFSFWKDKKCPSGNHVFSQFWKEDLNHSGFRCIACKTEITWKDVKNQWARNQPNL